MDWQLKLLLAMLYLFCNSLLVSFSGVSYSINSILQSISAYSGHYRPTDDRLDTFLSFLMENGLDLDEVEVLCGSFPLLNFVGCI